MFSAINVSQNLCKACAILKPVNDIDHKSLERINMRRLFFGTFAVCLLATSAVNADAISDRKAAMKNVGMAMGALVGMFKGEMDYNPVMASLAFATMNNASIGITSLFPAGTETGGKTSVNLKIWSDMDGFSTGMVKFQTDTAAAIAAKPADIEAFKPIFFKVAGNCKSCHEGFRLPGTY